MPVALSATLPAKILAGGLILAQLLVACVASPAERIEPAQAEPAATSAPAPALPPTPTPAPAIQPPPVSRQEQQELMAGFSQQIPFDGIRPVYNPRFVPAQQAGLEPDDLVMGVTFEGEAKAYPVSVLRFREMVNDEIAGRPILVSW